MAKLASKTYGDALFELAVEEQKADEFLQEVSAIRAALSENPELARLMDHPKIVKEEKIKLIEECFRGRVSDDMVGFLVIVVTKERYGELQDIFAYVTARIKEYKKIGVANVVSAIGLDDRWKKKIEQKLLETTGFETMEISYRVDKSLIGGLIIRIGDRVVDSSLKHKLEGLTGQLMKITLELEKEGVEAS